VSLFRRVVVDTSTLVSAAIRVGSVPHTVLAHVLLTGELCASGSTLNELELVLARPRFDRYQPADVRTEFAAILRRHARAFVVSEADERRIFAPCRDPKDNQFLALIRECAADALVSSDSDLLDMNPWNDVPILTPSAFMKEVIREA